MLDNALIQIFLPIIKNGLNSLGYTNVTVKAANQPTQQGANTNPTVYFYKLYDHRYGFLKRSSDYDPNTGIITHTEIQDYETTFQIEALVIQNPLVISYTASDLINIVAQIMQSDSTRQILFDAGIGILRITEIRNPYFVDDKGRFEASPSFDFTLTHRQISSIIDPAVNGIQPGIYPI